MSSHNVPDQRQAESRASNPLRHGIANPVELLEDPLLLGWINPDALISNFDDHRAARPPHGDSNFLCGY